MYLSDVVRNSLGDLPTQDDLTGLGYQESEEIFLKILEFYADNRDLLDPIPDKREGEIRPGFLNDYHLVGDPYPRNWREIAFSRKALVYADSVAVLDPLDGWLKTKKVHGLGGALMGNQSFPNGMADIWKIAVHAEYEEAGLIHYIPAPSFDSVNIPAMAEEALKGISFRDYGDLGSTTRGNEVVEALRPLQLIQQRHLGMRELVKALLVVSDQPSKLDLYLPYWTNSRELFDALLSGTRNALIDSELSPASASASEGLSYLMRLPSPGIESVLAMAPEEIVDLKKGSMFKKFQEDVRGILLDAIATSSESPQWIQGEWFRGKLSQRLTSFQKEFQRKGPAWKEWSWGGITPTILTGGISGLAMDAMSASSAEAAVSGAIGFGVPQAYMLMGQWLRARRVDKEAKQVESLYRVFLGG